MNNKISQNNIGTLVVSALFIIAGAITLYDTQSYSDLDSKVFPRAAAIVLILCASMVLIMSLIRPSKDEGFGSGSWRRRITLVATMLLCCFAMPYIGFLLAGAIAFVGGLISAMHDKWTSRNILIYWGSGAFIMIGFYALFRYALNVPLP